MKLDLFFATHPIFTVREIKTIYGKAKKKGSTIANLLQYHRKKGHVLLVRKGLYAVVPKEAQGKPFHVDPYLVASKLADDAILAYHTALSLYGKTYTFLPIVYYLTHTRVKKKFEFQDTIYQAVSFPNALKQPTIETNQFNRLGMPIMATTLERTFVDILDRPHLCLSWEEICRSIESIEYLKLDRVIEYTLLLKKRTTTAIVGFFLERFKEKWMVPQELITKLHNLRPISPFYLKRSMKGPQKLLPQWNMIVPQAILNKNWEEPHEDI